MVSTDFNASLLAPLLFDAQTQSRDRFYRPVCVFGSYSSKCKRKYPLPYIYPFFLHYFTITLPEQSPSTMVRINFSSNACCKFSITLFANLKILI